MADENKVGHACGECGNFVPCDIAEGATKVAEPQDAQQAHAVMVEVAEKQRLRIDTLEKLLAERDAELQSVAREIENAPVALTLKIGSWSNLFECLHAPGTRIESKGNCWAAIQELERQALDLGIEWAGGVFNEG